MGKLGGLVKFLFRRAVEGALVLLLITFLPNLPPFVNIIEPFRVAKFLPFEGPLELKEGLNDVEIWHKGDFLGPEAFVDRNGELYTSIYGGDIVKLTGEHITPVVKFGKPCKGVYEEKVCGRPLGMHFAHDGFLYAADAYYGIFKVNVQTGEKQQLVNSKIKINGKAPKIFNSIVVSSTGDIYWTDSSNEFSLEDGLYTFLADPSGRLIHYDPKTKKNTVLIEKLHFANGVALSQGEDFILVAETVRNRIHRYYLKGPKKGTTDIFIDGLPGLPDNLKADGKGGFLVPLVQAVDNSWPGIYQLIGPFPLLRKAVVRSVGIAHFIIRQINEVYPTEFGAKAAHFMGHFRSLPPLINNPRVTILRINKDGKITHSVHNLNKKIAQISEAHVFKDTLYLGSPFNNYIARISLDKIGWNDLQNVRIKRSIPEEAAPTTKTAEQPKATTTMPQPTTTTQKPATQAPTTQKPATTTQKPVTQAPTTQKPKPTTQKPATQAPTTQKPAPTTQKPVTQAPTTEKPAPSTQKPVSQKPATQPAKEAPKPGSQPPKEAPKPSTQPPKPNTQIPKEAPKPASQPPKGAPKPASQPPKEAPKPPKPNAQSPKEAPKPATQPSKEAAKPATQPPKEAPKPATEAPKTAVPKQAPSEGSRRGKNEL